MSATGSRSLLTGYKHKTPANQLGRLATHVDTGSPVAEDATKSHNSARRPNITNKKPSPSLASTAMRLERQYKLKTKRYEALRKDLTDKQKTAQELFNEMSRLREKVMAAGAKDPGKMDDLKLEVGSTKQILSTTEQNDRASPPPSIELEEPPSIAELLESFETQLREAPKGLQDFCQDALGKYSTFVSSVLSWLAIFNKENQERNLVDPVVTTQLEIQQRDVETLRARLNELRVVQTRLSAKLLNDAKEFRSRYEAYRARWKESGTLENRNDLRVQLNAALEELQSERDRSNQTKERLKQTETLLQKARTKIRELETRLVNDEGKIQQLQGHAKSLELQTKQKDQLVEQRLKDMQKALKNSESLMAKVEKQRDGYESRLLELKEKMRIKENEAINNANELSSRLELANEIDAEREKRLQAETALTEMEKRCRSLEEKSQQLAELAERSKELTTTDGRHADNEVRLYNELKQARRELEEQREKNEKLSREKQEIIAAMDQVANREEDDDSKEKLAAELGLKRNELQNLTAEYLKLKDIAMVAEDKASQLERQLTEIQTLRPSQAREENSFVLYTHLAEREQRIASLRHSLMEITKQKEELETALTRKQLELEQRDRMMHEQGKILKVRDELLGILKERMIAHDETSNSESNAEEPDEIAKAISLKNDDIVKLFETLERKEVHAMLLENMVTLLENQHVRAEAQRTRLENRIAQLELALQESKEHRYVGRRSFRRIDRDEARSRHFSTPGRPVLSPSSSSRSLSTPRERRASPKKRPSQFRETVDYYEHEGTCSDEEQPYVCERCRPKSRFSRRNKDRETSTGVQEFCNWSTEASMRVTREDGEEIFRGSSEESPSVSRDQHGDSDSTEDGSREQIRRRLVRSCKQTRFFEGVS